MPNNETPALSERLRAVPGVGLDADERRERLQQVADVCTLVARLPPESLTSTGPGVTHDPELRRARDACRERLQDLALSARDSYCPDPIAFALRVGSLCRDPEILARARNDLQASPGRFLAEWDRVHEWVHLAVEQAGAPQPPPVAQPDCPAARQLRGLLVDLRRLREELDLVGEVADLPAPLLNDALDAAERVDKSIGAGVGARLRHFDRVTPTVRYVVRWARNQDGKSWIRYMTRTSDRLEEIVRLEAVIEGRLDPDREVAPARLGRELVAEALMEVALLESAPPSSAEEPNKDHEAVRPPRRQWGPLITLRVGEQSDDRLTVTVSDEGAERRKTRIFTAQEAGFRGRAGKPSEGFTILRTIATNAMRSYPQPQARKERNKLEAQFTILRANLRRLCPDVDGDPFELKSGSYRPKFRLFLLGDSPGGVCPPKCHKGV